MRPAYRAFRYNGGVRGGAVDVVKLEPYIDLPFLMTGVWSRFGVHLFHGRVTTDDIDRIERDGDAWLAKHPGRTVEMVVIYPSGARMSTSERMRFARLLKRHEKNRAASATVILAEGLTGAVHRSVLTALLRLAPPPHPVKVFGSTREAVIWLQPHVAALCGPRATAEALVAAVDEMSARFRSRLSAA
jgi:hypothetical protein